MLRDMPCKCEDILCVDGVSVEFTLAQKETQVGMHAFDTRLSLTKTAGRLWLLYGL